MKNRLYKKNLTIGVLILFIGAIFTPSIGSINSISLVEFENINKFEGISNINSTVVNPEGVDWWDNNWLFRKQITIDHINIEDNLENFPVLVRLTMLNPKNQSQPDGDDFVFTTSDGMKLNHEIERYSKSSGELIAWVNITSLSSVDDTVIYLYYGNNDCSNQANVHGTWDSDFWGVWHLKEGSGSARKYDSTSNGRDFNGHSGDPESVDGKIGKCQEFDGDDHIGMDSKKIGQVHTISFWVKINGFKEEQEILGTNGGKYICQFLDIYNKLYYVNNGQAIESTADITSQFIWYYITVIRDSDHGFWYINADNSTSTIGNPTGNTTIAGLGGYEMYGQGSFMIGNADELRISTTIRSNAWINASYKNQNDPESFMTIGEQETIPMKFSLLFGEIANLSTFGDFTFFDAINLVSIKFIPFSIKKVTTGETITTSKLKLGILKEDFIFGLFKNTIK